MKITVTVETEDDSEHARVAMVNALMDAGVRIDRGSKHGHVVYELAGVRGEYVVTD